MTTKSSSPSLVGLVPIAKAATQVSLQKVLKLLFAAGLTVLASHTLLERYVLTVSTSATVTAATSTVRAPISGLVNLAVAQTNESFAKGVRLVTVSNDLVDTSRLNALQGELASARAEKAVFSELRDRLAGMSADFSKNASAYQVGRIQQIDALMAQTAAQAEAERAKDEQAATRLLRAGALSEAGLFSAQQLEEAQRDRKVAEQSARAAEAVRGSVEANLKAVRNGTNLDTTTDKPYSRQRWDELKLRLAEIAAQVEKADRRSSALEIELAAESKRVDKNTETVVDAPFAGRVWRKFASSGEYVREGFGMIDVIDCSKFFVVASVQERSLERLHVGTEADFELDGSSARYRAVVVQLFGPLAPSNGAIGGFVEVANPIRDDPPFRVLLAIKDTLERERSSCEIGHSGQVHFHVNAFSRWFG